MPVVAKPVRILVCGSNYGRSYVEALRLAGPGYQLAGILARGSLRSQVLAADCAVPLYRRVEDLPPDVDLACTAMGTSAFDIVLQILRRGTNVLCEHPIRTAQLREALKTAVESGVHFHVNGHFAELPATQRFISRARDQLLFEDALFLQVVISDRALYSTLDILHLVFDSLSRTHLTLVRQDGLFAVLEGSLGILPAVLQLQYRSTDRQSHLPDGDAGYVVDQRLTIGFSSGILTLLGIAGPTLWNSNAARTASSDPLWSVVHGDTAMTPRSLLEARRQANLRAIECAIRCSADEVVPPHQDREHMLEVSNLWETISETVAASLRARRQTD